MTPRELVVASARADLGLSDPKRYWEVVLGSTWRGPFPKHWCGAFALYHMRAAGLCDWDWVVGRGFLFRLEQTRGPQPGDIGYIDRPYQHHFIVEKMNDDGTVTSLDGNQGTPGVQRQTRPWRTHAYYSIGELLEKRDTDRAPAPEHPTLRMNSMATQEVFLLQRELNRHGSSLKLDGQFGPKTAQTVMSFQRQRGLDADGVVGPETWKALWQNGTS